MFFIIAGTDYFTDY